MLEATLVLAGVSILWLCVGIYIGAIWRYHKSEYTLKQIKKLRDEVFKARTEH